MWRDARINGKVEVVEYSGARAKNRDSRSRAVVVDPTSTLSDPDGNVLAAASPADRQITGRTRGSTSWARRALSRTRSSAPGSTRR